MLPKDRISGAGASWMHRHGKNCIVFISLFAVANMWMWGGVSMSRLSLYFLPQQQAQKKQKQSEARRALMLHEQGHWVHQYNLSNNESDGMSFNNASAIRKTYLPSEINWMMGKDLTDIHLGKCFQERDGLMYKSHLGNQCGSCSGPDFKPSLSTWALPSSTANTYNVQQPDHDIISPSLRLILRLAKANSTLCFAGDSIDFQFHDALRHNLLRQRQLQNLINISISENRIIPVNYTNETGRPQYTGFMAMDEILERVVSLKYNSDNSTTYSARVRYFKTYGWSPWNTVWMDDCNIVVYTLGIHYGVLDEMKGVHWGKPKYYDDFRGAVTYMADFASSRKNRVAVWRSTLPQHFNTSDGHHEQGKLCTLKHWKLSDDEAIQSYNKATESAFSKFCNESHTQTPFDHRLEHDCTVNRTSVEYRTVYNFLRENNCTKRLERFEGNPIATGKILRWNVADLFDQPQWHHSINDCSHFCYITPLYEAAFERLELLLPPLG